MSPLKPASPSRPSRTARACCRVDLAGGTLDIWPLGQLHPGSATVNVAIDLWVSVRLEPASAGYSISQAGRTVRAATAAELRRHDDGALAGTLAEALDLPFFTAELASESPRGGGLGASSAMTVAMIAAAEAAFGRRASAAGERAAQARDVEARLMGLPTGTQDHLAALHGGALAIRHRAGGAEVERLAIDLDRFGASLVVAYSGQSHFSAGQNWQVVRRRLDHEPEVTALLGGIAEVAVAMAEVLSRHDLAAAGALMAREWDLRRQLASGISTPALEHLLAAARQAGAWGGKACGAGGGGSIAVLAPPERRSAVVAALRQAGGQVLAVRAAATALTVS